MKKKKATPRRKPAKKTSTALARRSDVARFKIEDPNGMLSPNSPEGFELGELAHTGGVGIGTVKLSAAELKIISRAVNQPDVRVLPDSGLAYLPHLYYTRWLNEAFGPTGWGIVPMSAPKKVDSLIIIPHARYIRGVAVAWAYGAAEYYEKNKRQTYDDVLESTVAYSLRRCCKRLGMALELWDKRWLAKFLAMDCIQVQTDKGKAWRRRDDPPFDNERAGSKAPASKVHEGVVMDPEPGDDGNGRAKISKAEAARLVRIWRGAGRADSDVQLWLAKTYGYKATADIKRFDYLKIERAVTARGELHIPGDGE